MNVQEVNSGYTLKLWSNKKLPNSLRIDSTMKDVDPLKIINFKGNPEVMKKQGVLFQESIEIERVDDTTSLYYIKLSMPMMTERDDVIQIMIKDLSNESWYIGLTSVQNDKYPSKNGVV